MPRPSPGARTGLLIPLRRRVRAAERAAVSGSQPPPTLGRSTGRGPAAPISRAHSGHLAPRPGARIAVRHELSRPAATNDGSFEERPARRLQQLVRTIV